MSFSKKWMLRLSVLIVLGALISSCGFKRKKYENPITKDTQQPDKVLFDKAINDMERGRYEVARLTLQTLMNTYDTSEYLAKAKLAYADSWFREGGTHGMAQAEAEYKDFILFYPTLEESAEAQEKVCMIHYRQMEKADRDPTHAMRAEDECRNLLVQFPNSKFAPEAQQLLRNIQEVLAEHEMKTATFYHNKGSNPAAANRLQALSDQYPLYSHADQANWDLADSYGKMGPRFRQKEGEALSRIVREYPLSSYVDNAKKKLQQLELPVPEADPVAYARMKYELENRTKKGMTSSAMGFLKRGPDVHTAAKSGTPAMTNLRPTIPVSVPSAAAAGAFTGEVTAAPVTDSTALENKPDARATSPASTGTAAANDAADATAAKPDAAAATTSQPLPANGQAKPGKQKKPKKQKKPAPQQQ